MSDQRIAYRYAKALLELAEESKVLSTVHEDMQLLKSVCQENRDFNLMLHNPIVPHGKKNVILRKLFDKKVHKITNSFISILSGKNRERMLEPIAEEFNNLYNVKKGIDEASVTTTFALDKELRTEFLKKVKGMTGNEVILNEKVNKEIIGGYILTISDRQLDESVRSKLKELEHSFNENP